MSSRRIALRYAKPLIDLAIEQKALDKVKADMQNFSDICTESRDFFLMLKSPIIPHLRKAEILKSIFKARAHALTLAAFDIITRKNRESILPNIAEEFVNLYNEKMGLVEATVTTTYPLEDGQRNAFREMVKSITGKEALLEEAIDKDILGGYVLRMDDRQVDESIASHLAEIRLRLNTK
jgi:F-type H+-transporting ATPase subunit delta